MAGPQTTTYDTAGSHEFDWPEGETYALVQVWGGGAGGGASTDDFGGAGGGGGGYSRELVARADGIDTLEVTVGAGGTAGDDGEDSTVMQDAELVARATGGSTSPGDLEAGDSGVGTVEGANQAIHYGGIGGGNEPIVTMFFTTPSYPGGAGGGAGAGQNINGGAGGRPNESTPGNGGAAAMKGGAGGRGGKGIDDTPAEDGENGEAPGGGGGGGGQGKASGAGAPGMVKITCPAPPESGSDCCCGCPPGRTKDYFGLPDTINQASGGATSSSDGMPADEVIGTCGGGDIYARWTASSAFAGVLDGHTLTYQGQEGPGCCFLYTAEGTEDGCGGSGDLFDLGESPFEAVAIAESVTYATWGENTAIDPDPPNTGVCCPQPSQTTCRQAAGNAIEWSGGIAYIPNDIFGKPTLRICINEQLVTITASVEMLLTYTTATHAIGSPCIWKEKRLIGTIYPECAPAGWETICSGTVTNCGVVGLPMTLSVSVTQDLSEVSGATIWDKIQNATWTGNYSYAICNVGGGCTGHELITRTTCEVTDTCGYVQNDYEEISETYGQPVDQQCLFGSGEVTLSFS